MELRALVLGARGTAQGAFAPVCLCSGLVADETLFLPLALVSFSLWRRASGLESAKACRAGTPDDPDEQVFRRNSKAAGELDQRVDPGNSRFPLQQADLRAVKRRAQP